MPNWPAPSRLAVIITVSLALLAGTWAWLSLRQQQAHDATLERQYRLQSTLLASLLIRPIVARDHGEVEARLEQVNEQNNLVYARVYDRNSEVLAEFGSPPSLRQSITAEMRFLSQLQDSLLDLERPLQLDDSVVGALQLGYRLPYATPLDSLVALWPALAITVLVLVLAPLLALQRLREHQHALGQMESELAALTRGQSDQLPEQPDPLQLIVERINKLVSDHREIRNSLEQRRSQAETRIQLHGQLLQGLGANLWETGSDRNRLTRIEGPTNSLCGHSEQEWLEANFLQQQVHPGDFRWLDEHLQNPPKPDEDPAHTELRLRDGDGQWRWLRLALMGAGRSQGALGSMQDITESKRNERRVTELSHQDVLTGLSNRIWFRQQLAEQITAGQRSQKPGALFFLDLDRFEFVNSIFGPDAGDDFLRQFSQALSSLFSEIGYVARLGGDEFGVILPDTNSEAANEYATQLITTLQKLQFDAAGSNIPFSTSIGIALFPEHGSQPSDLLRRAASALQQAKERGRGTFHITSRDDEQHEDPMDDARVWEERLRRALDEDHFTLYFQPIIDLDVGVIHYYECLLRLLEPGGDKAYGPMLFFNAAERLGLRDEIERRALVKAIRAQGVVNRSGHPVSLTINLSIRQLNRAELVDLIRTAARDHGAQPKRIMFEIGAKTAANNIQRIRQVVTELRQDGYRFAWDDFGVGALSFEDLRSVPVDYLKIDGELVTKIVWSPADRAMVRAISDLAQGLNIALMAEAVETEHMLRILREYHVAFGQGRLFAEPAPRFHEHERIIVSDYERRRS